MKKGQEGDQVGQLSETRWLGVDTRVKPGGCVQSGMEATVRPRADGWYDKDYIFKGITLAARWRIDHEGKSRSRETRDH